MKQFFIITNKYLNSDGSGLSIGGVETYIRNLCHVMKEIGIVPTVYQIGETPFESLFEGVVIRGISESAEKFSRRVLSMLPKEEVVIFANDEVVYGTYCGTTVYLQHGISWDYQLHRYRGALFEVLFRLLDLKKDLRRIRNLQKADHVVCVDYQYLTWYRTQVNHCDTNFRVIPNFTQTLPKLPEKPKDRINVIFARRFVDYRGTRLFVEAIADLIVQYPALHVTFAGNGPDETWMRERLAGYERVRFTKYSSESALEVHADQHIAVVPSVGSEGTSLSLLEAMAAGCAVICTNVGGMTNIVLDHYNGLITAPEVPALQNALRELTESKSTREAIAKKAFETASCAFSRDKWAASWKQFLLEIADM